MNQCPPANTRNDNPNWTTPRVFHVAKAKITLHSYPNRAALPSTPTPTTTTTTTRHPIIEKCQKLWRYYNTPQQILLETPPLSIPSEESYFPPGDCGAAGGVVGAGDLNLGSEGLGLAAAFELVGFIPSVCILSISSSSESSSSLEVDMLCSSCAFWLLPSARSVNNSEPSPRCMIRPGLFFRLNRFFTSSPFFQDVQPSSSSSGTCGFLVSFGFSSPSELSSLDSSFRLFQFWNWLNPGPRARAAIRFKCGGIYRISLVQLDHPYSWRVRQPCRTIVLWCYHATRQRWWLSYCHIRILHHHCLERDSYPWDSRRFCGVPVDLRSLVSRILQLVHL